jgi:hypothetical protein
MMTTSRFATMREAAMQPKSTYLFLFALALAGLFGASVLLSAQANVLEAFLLDAREDVEMLADRVFGPDDRPAGWTANADVASATVIGDLWFDNELLADSVFAGNRPGAWIGATTQLPELLARNVRHDLEVSADTFLGPDIRPVDWNGAPAIYRCSRTTLNQIYILENFQNIQPQTPAEVVNFCGAVAIEIEETLIEGALAETTRAQLPDLIQGVRRDLERLADAVMPDATRPAGWIGTGNPDSPAITADILADLNALADSRLGIGQRPDAWIGLVSGSLPASYRNLRFDLESLASSLLVPDTFRPDDWEGADPLLRCEPAIQNLVYLVNTNYGGFDTSGFGSESETFCLDVERAANDAAEAPPRDIEGEPIVTSRFEAESDWAFAYLDPAATQYMGSMPGGTAFRAWYRNFGDSTMMFVSGENFAVFIDQRWTTLPENTFRDLPTTEGVRPLTFCDANWCNGPGPTPTPTGAGALGQLLVGAATAAPTIDPTQGAIIPDKRLVNWNHIRVNYILQRPEVNAAQVTLEICNETAQIACEPVLSVTNTLNGASLPVVGTAGGLTVFEIPYGYSNFLRIEGATLYSNDIWINDPTLLTPIGSG